MSRLSSAMLQPYDFLKGRVLLPLGWLLKHCSLSCKGFCTKAICTKAGLKALLPSSQNWPQISCVSWMEEENFVHSFILSLVSLFLYFQKMFIPIKWKENEMNYKVFFWGTTSREFDQFKLLDSKLLLSILSVEMILKLKKQLYKDM